MARPYSRKHLFWLIPLILALLLAAMWGTLRLLGWSWHGVGWRQGLTVDRIRWHDEGCLRLEAHHVRLRGLWPLQLQMDTLGLPACPDDDDTAEPLALPAAPPFDISIWALQYQDQPPVRIRAHHRGEHWWLKADVQESRLRGDYHSDSGRWDLTGQVQAGHVNRRLNGLIQVRGNGHWRPEAATAATRFSGQLALSGMPLDLPPPDSAAALAAALSWQGEQWTLQAHLGDQALALGHGWWLQPGPQQGLAASGQGLAVTRADVSLTAEGPQGHATLRLHSNDEHLGRGQGQLVLGGGLGGQVDVRWAEGRMTVLPFKLTGPNGVALALRQAISAPFAMEGDITPDLALSYRDVHLQTTDSHLHWRPNDIQWRGAVALSGQWEGYRLAGGWRGDIGPTGVHGEPVRVTLDGNALQVRARIPVAGVAPPHWPLQAELQGHFRGNPFSGRLSAGNTGPGWAGKLRARTALPGMDQGGEMTLRGQWQWQDGFRLLPGARLSLAPALVNDTLIRPAQLAATSALTLDGTGLHGRFRLAAEGLAAARWVLPPLRGQLEFEGWCFSATLQIPQWQSTLAVKGQQLDGVPQGTLHLQTPLSPAVSRGLDVTVRAGHLALDGNWRAGRDPRFEGRLQGENVALDWGGIRATGLQADVALRWQEGRWHLQGRQPLTLAQLNVGIPITDIRLGLSTDLTTWRVHDVHATLLGGRLLAPALVWPSPAWQPVILTGIRMARLAALQSKPVVELSGAVGGYLPLQLQQRTLAIRGGHLANETPLTLSIPQTNGVRSLAQSNTAVKLALDAINPLRINDFQARIDMNADGWLNAAVTIKGVNPTRGKLPVVFHYTHQENVLELLRSLRIGDSITDALMQRTSTAVERGASGGALPTVH